MANTADKTNKKAVVKAKKTTTTTKAKHASKPQAKTQEKIVPEVQAKKEPILFLVHQKEADKTNRRRTISAVYKDGKLSFGVSTCGPKDSFCKKIGRTISVNRASTAPIRQITLGDLDLPIVRQVFFANAMGDLTTI